MMRIAILGMIAIAGCSELPGSDAGVDADLDGGPITTIATLEPFGYDALDVVGTSLGDVCVCSVAGHFRIPDPPTGDLSIACYVPEGIRRWRQFDDAPEGQMGCLADPSGELFVLISPGASAIATRVVRLGPEATTVAERVLFSEREPLSDATAAANQDFVVVTGRGPTALRVVVLAASDLSFVRLLESPVDAEEQTITVAIDDGGRALLAVTDSVGGTFVPEGGSALLSFALPDGALRVEATYPGRVVEAVLTQGGEHLVVTSGTGGLTVHRGDVVHATGFATLLHVAWSGERVWVQQEALGGSPQRIVSLTGESLMVEWGMPFRPGPMRGIGDGSFYLARDDLSIVR